LETLLLIFAVAAAADLAGRPRSTILIVTAAVSAVLYFVLPDVNVLHLRNTLFLYPFFVFGVLLYRFPALGTSSMSLPIALPLTLAYPVAYNILGAALPGTPLDALLSWVSGSAATVLLLRLMPRMSLLEMISIYSFTIYLWHPAASALIRTFLDTVGIGQIWLLFLLGLVAGVAIPIAIHRVAERVPVFGRILKG
jgi:peptidoglycan/LPS O-acetylase OafA/YrhL